ncbi:MAG: hypothetical protein HRT89_18940 [Lentisphaeria bacterium]|nr:hypothetical protein [Lentisphaeria bacterium]
MKQNRIQVENYHESGILAQKILDSGIRKLAVVSCEDYAGKSTLCRMLALYFMNQKRIPVKLCEFNMRHPKHILNDLTNKSKKSDLQNPILETCTPPQNFMQLSSFERQKWLQQNLDSEDPDQIIIIDTSPIHIYNQNNIHPIHLKEFVNDFIIVVNTHTTTHSDYLAAAKIFESNGMTILGTVLNYHLGPHVKDYASLTHWREIWQKIKILTRKFNVKLKLAFRSLIKNNPGLENGR